MSMYFSGGSIYPGVGGRRRRRRKRASTARKSGTRYICVVKKGRRSCHKRHSRPGRPRKRRTHRRRTHRRRRTRRKR